MMVCYTPGLCTISVCELWMLLAMWKMCWSCQPGETEEEYEERRWKGRTQQMMHIVSRGLQKNTQVGIALIFNCVYFASDMRKMYEIHATFVQYLNGEIESF